MTLRGRNTLLMGAVSVFIIAILATSARRVEPATHFTGPRPLVIAHQGGNLLRPGNTLVAFDHARDLGVDVLEFDVHLTADKLLAVIHDATLMRTTDGQGAVSDFTLAQLRDFDAGFHWPFTGEERPWRGRGLTIPGVTEVLNRYPKLRFNIELKDKETSRQVEAGRVLCRLLKSATAVERTLVAATPADGLLAYRAACPAGYTSAYANEALRFYGLHFLGLVGLHQAGPHGLQVPLERYGIDLVTASTLRSAHRRKLVMHAWTINDRAEMQRLLALGVDGLITDRPDELLELVRQIEAN